MIYKHVDIYGAITQHPKFGADEGDSAFFSGHMELTRQLAPCVHHNYVKPVDPLLFFPDKNGELVRHAKAKKPWIRKKDRGSRDQYTSWICYLAIRSQEKLKPALRDIAKLLVRRFGFFTNVKKNGVLKTPNKVPDFITPEVLSILLRGILGKGGYPLYYLFDAWLVLDALYTRYFKNDSDVANFLSILLTSNTICPTILSRLALRLTSYKQMKSYLYDYFTYRPSKEVAHTQMHRNPWFLAECYIIALLKYKDPK